MDFYQLKVHFETLTEEKAAPEKNIPDAAVQRTGSIVRSIDFSLENLGTDVDDEERGAEPAIFSQWLYGLTRSSIGSLSMEELNRCRDELHSVFESITYKRNGTRYFSSKFDHLASIGELSLLISYFIEYYGESRNFDSADQKFNIAIKPYINKMTANQIIRLIEVTENNSQIYNRGAARSANNIIVAKAKEILPPDFDYSHYKHFRFDEPEVADDAKNPDSLPF